MKYLVQSYSSNEILFSGNWIMGTESNGGAPKYSALWVSGISTSG